MNTLESIDKESLFLNFNLPKNECLDIYRRLNRIPNDLEKKLFSSMWSEHCSYKHSRLYLKDFYKDNSFCSFENSGAVPFGNLCVFFKTESHNHPSAIEPFEGASTGIGGIIRDILAMNARPVALLDGLMFSFDKSIQSKHLFNEVVRGISVYGNSIGVPVISGETQFNNCYKKNPLVNVTAVGVGEFEKIKSANGVKDKSVILLGSKTGKDGINGASFASCNFQNQTCEKVKHQKLHVQMSDPFMKKKLMEACLEIFKLKEVVCSQDLGASGLLCAASEIAYNGNCSIVLNLEKVLLRQKDMTPDEILLSESQERMLVLADVEAEEKILEIAKKHEIFASVIGKTFEGDDFVVKFKDKILACLNLDVLCRSVEYTLDANRFSLLKYILKQKLKKDNQNKSQEKPQKKQNNKSVFLQLKENIEKMIADPNFASKEFIFSQYDYLVGNSTVVEPKIGTGVGAIVLENGNIAAFKQSCELNKPLLFQKNSTILGILDAYRKLVASGFKPNGITNCLNFADIRKDHVAYLFKETIEGLKEFSYQFKIPVISGNVSFHNETDDREILPSPVFCLSGKAESIENMIKSYFEKDQFIFLLGEKNKFSNFKKNISYHKKLLYNDLSGAIEKPDFDLELKYQEAIEKLNQEKIIESCVCVSSFGLFGALFKGLVEKKLGFDGKLLTLKSREYFKSKLKHEKIDILEKKLSNELFGESVKPRYLIGAMNFDDIVDFCESKNLNFSYLGRTNNMQKISFNALQFDKERLFEIYEKTFENHFEM